MLYRVKVKSDDIVDGAVTSVKIADGAVTASKISKSFGSEITQTVAAGGTYVIPEGIYVVVVDSSTVILEISTDGGTTWYGSAPPSGAVISDGTNVRLRNTDTADHTAYLLPLA